MTEIRANTSATPAAAAEHRAGERVTTAALLMVLGQACFVTLAVLVKLAADEATPMQAVLYRSVFSALPLLGVMAHGRVPVPSRRWRLLLLRGAVGFGALYCYLWAVAHIRLADVLALQQMSPIFVAFLSIWLLGERPAASHYLLAGVCLAGALLIIQPTRGVASLGASMALVSALFSSAAYVAVRALTRTEPTPRIVLWFSVTAAALALPFVLPGWRWPSTRASLLLIGAGLFAAVAQTLMTAAYRRAPAHVTSAFSYASVPFAYLAGLLLWGERPDALASAGILLIVVAGVAIVYSARAGARDARRAPSGGTGAAAARVREP